MSGFETFKLKFRSAFAASITWAGEAVVGLIPLLAFQILQLFSKPTVELYSCPVKASLSGQNCTMVSESISQEVCILTVVISGLALWSLFKIGSGEDKVSITVFTQIQIIFSVLSLLTGAILYALFGAHIAKNADGLAYTVLVVALASSLFITLERELLRAAT